MIALAFESSAAFLRISSILVKELATIFTKKLFIKSALSRLKLIPAG